MEKTGTKGKVQIANPLYDVVFRYMMEDNKVAKLFLSVIIGKDIKELIFSPTEYSSKIGLDNSITVTRMDFNARIQEADGKETVVIIELQKAKFYYQIMRFRKYLGKQYQNPQNVDRNDKPLPIYPIYILGEAFTEAPIPVIRVNRNYVDVATGKNLTEKHHFIESLTHDATVIQIPHLRQHRRTTLERFLSIFDQTNQLDMKGHILAIDEADYPKSYHPVIRRLIKALQTPKIEYDMDIEDEVIHEFNKQAKLLEREQQKVEEGKKRIKEEKQRVKEEKQRVKEEKQRAEKASQREEEERQAKNQLIKKLASLQMSAKEIAEAAGMDEAEVLRLLEEWDQSPKNKEKAAPKERPLM